MFRFMLSTNNVIKCDSFAEETTEVWNKTKHVYNEYVIGWLPIRLKNQATLTGVKYQREARPQKLRREARMCEGG